MVDVHIFSAVSGNALRLVSAFLLGEVAFHFLLGRSQVIAQGSHVHVAVVIQPGKILHVLQRGAKGLLGHLFGTGIALLLGQGFQGLGKVVQVLLVHGIEPEGIAVAVEEFGCRNIRQINLIILQVGLVGLFLGQSLFLRLQGHGLGGIPGIQGPLQKILLPAGHAGIHRAHLGIQGRIKVRGLIPVFAAILGNLCPVIGAEQAVGQLLLSYGSHYRIRASLSGIGSLAGYILRISIRRRSSRRRRFCRHRGLSGRLFLTGRRCRLHILFLSAARQYQHQRQYQGSPSFCHTVVFLFYS